MGLVKSPVVPPSIARRLVSGSPWRHCPAKTERQPWRPCAMTLLRPFHQELEGTRNADWIRENHHRGSAARISRSRRSCSFAKSGTPRQFLARDRYEGL
jgi:hypothetical protein